MGNIRHEKLASTSQPAESEFTITIEGYRFTSCKDWEPVDRVDENGDFVGTPIDFGGAVRKGVETARREDAAQRDAQRFAEPLDADRSAALRDLYASNLTGAEKVAAYQALQRMSSENNCGTCGGDGWVGDEWVNEPYYPGGVGASIQTECPQCKGRAL